MVTQQDLNPKNRGSIEMDDVTMQYILKNEFCILTIDQVFHIYKQVIDDPQVEIDDIFNHIMTTHGLFEFDP